MCVLYDLNMHILNTHTHTHTPTHAYIHIYVNTHAGMLISALVSRLTHTHMCVCARECVYCNV